MPALVGPPLQASVFDDLDAFGVVVDEMVLRHDAIVVDCDALRSLDVTALRLLERASRRGIVILTNAPPAVCLFAAVFGLRVEPPGEHP
jgi:hypothetical protein